jgi:Fe-S cluster assembly iron-binding protein IscA
MSSDAVQDGEDVVIERDGAKVVVDQTSLDFIKGNFNEHLFVGW